MYDILRDTAYTTCLGYNAYRLEDIVVYCSTLAHYNQDKVTIRIYKYDRLEVFCVFRKTLYYYKSNNNRVPARVIIVYKYHGQTEFAVRVTDRSTMILIDPDMQLLIHPKYITGITEMSKEPQTKMGRILQPYYLSGTIESV